MSNRHAITIAEGVLRETCNEAVERLEEELPGAGWDTGWFNANLRIRELHRRLHRDGINTDGSPAGYPSLVAASQRVANLNPLYPSLGSGMLVTIVNEAREALELAGYPCAPTLEPPEPVDAADEGVTPVDAADAHYAHRFFRGVRLDPYRIAKVYEIPAGPRWQILKKALRGTDKGQTEEQVIDDMQVALDRWREMLKEDAQ